MSTTTETTTTFPTRHVFPKNIARALSDQDLREMAERWADTHRVHTVAERYTNRVASFVPFRTAGQANDYALGLATDDQRSKPRKDRRPVHVVTVSPETTPTKGGAAVVHAHEEHVPAVISNVTATGVSVRVGGGKAKHYKRTGRGRYVSGSTVVTLA